MILLSFIAITYGDEKLNIYYSEQIPYMVNFEWGVHGIVADRLHKLLNLINIKQQWQEISSKQSIIQINSNQDKGCMITSMKFNSTDIMPNYTNAIFITSQYHLITRSNDHRFDNHRLNGALDLRKIFSDHSLTMISRKQSAYDNKVSKLIKKYNPIIMYINAKDNLHLLRKLILQHVDYFLINQLEAETLINYYQLDISRFKVHELTETYPGPRYYLLCNQNVKKTLINKINLSITKLD